MIDHTRLSDLRSHEFSKSFRGYSPGEVDDFLHLLFDDVAALIEGAAEAAGQIRTLEDERESLRKREESLGQTLLAAQAAAEEWKAVARREADQILRDARSQAEEATRKARLEAEGILREARERSGILEEGRGRLRQELSLTLSRLRGEFDALYEAIDRWEKGVSSLERGTGGEEVFP
ncbi:MAG: DivIVA domain-containing protein [Leptospirillia bacterium]